MTKPEFSAGLADIVVGETNICFVDPNGTLLYRGFSADELSERLSFEEIAHLLLIGHLPEKEELKKFSEAIKKERNVPDELLNVIKLFPKDAHPMDILRTSVSYLGMLDKDAGDKSREANLKKAVKLLAKLPTIMTAAHRISHGERPVEPDPSLNHSQNLLYMLFGKKPADIEAEAVNASLILYAEHEFNASTFAARVTASTLSDMYAAVTSGIGTLKGPLHGGANEAAMYMMKEIGEPHKAESYIMEKLAKKEKIMGFGHRVYKSVDSRAEVMRSVARKLSENFGETKWYKIEEKLVEVMKREKNIFPNLDLPCAIVYYMLNIPIPLYTPIFVCSRVSGWAAHVMEQLDNNKLIRPSSIYTGNPKRNLPPEAI
ncbi:MAG: citrate synthase [Deltaproteobacteria bacterium RIFCSPLOWO2_02_FULL_47_10]|nr:MAG: citrate synthase [Deltaproteobacteria bacterium RIFCSPLOWO2_02_FULL_47_10]